MRGHRLPDDRFCEPVSLGEAVASVWTRIFGGAAGAAPCVQHNPQAPDSPKLPNSVSVVSRALPGALSRPECDGRGVRGDGKQIRESRKGGRNVGRDD